MTEKRKKIFGKAFWVLLEGSKWPIFKGFPLEDGYTLSAMILIHCSAVAKPSAIEPQYRRVQLLALA
jgi:hypothetical protein